MVKYAIFGLKSMEKKNQEPNTHSNPTEQGSRFHLFIKCHRRDNM